MVTYSPYPTIRASISTAQFAVSVRRAMVRSSDETCWAVFSMITIVTQHSAGLPQTDFPHCTGEETHNLDAIDLPSLPTPGLTIPRPYPMLLPVVSRREPVLWTGCDRVGMIPRY